MSALWKNIKENLSKSSNWLFILCLIYTLVYMGMIFLHFFSNGHYKLDASFSGFYIPLLSAYAGNKEISRWVGKKITIQRPGELMVYLLWIVPPTLFCINQLAEGTYDIPEDIKFVCIFVISLFAASRVSKNIHEMQNKKNKSA